MAYEADKVVVELIAKTEALDAPVKQSASTFDANMNKIVASATKAEQAVARSSSARSSALQRESAQISQFSRILARDMDIAGAALVGSNSPFVLPVKQAPAVSNAMRLVSVGGTALGGVLTTVATGGVALLALGLFELISKLHDTGNEVDELVEKLKQDAQQSERTRQAKEIFKTTLEGVTKALDDNEDALKRLSDGELSAAQDALRAALAANGRLESIRNTTQALLDQARAQLEVNNAQAIGPETKTGRADPNLAAANAARSRIDALQKKVGDVNSLIVRSEQQITDALSRYAVEAASRDPSDKIKRRYDLLIESTRQRLVNEKATTAEIVRQTAELIKQRDVELKALSAKKKASTGSGFSGNQIDFAQAKAIARGAGLQVNSDQRSYAEQKKLYDAWMAAGRPRDNPVAPPGTSAHEGAKGRWALDIQLAPGVTAGKIKKLYADQGVSVNVFPERGHLHVSGSRSAAAAADNAAARAAAQERQREQVFQNEKAQVEGDILDARRALALSADQVAQFETLAVEQARKHTDEQITAAQEAGKLLPQEAVELKLINDERAKYRQQLVDLRLRQAQFAQAEENFARGRDFQSASYEAEADLLHSQEGLAKSANERRQIEQRLIDLQFQEERLKSQYVIDWAERVQANKDATDKEKADAVLAEQIAKMHQATIDQRQSNATYQNAQSNASPLQDYFNQIPQTADQINEAFESIAAHGLQTFNDSLANAIVNFTSLRDVARTVLGSIATDLIKLALQQIELHTIGAALGAASVATTTATAAAVGAAWAGPAALATLATLGTNAGPAAAAIASTVGLATILGAPKARGGRILGSGSDSSDNILTPSSPGEFMVKASSARQVGYDALGYINQHGALPGRISPSNGIATAPGGSGGFSSSDLGQLRGIVSEAIKAMPDVSLYASLDPVDVLQRALGTTTGSRALIAHLGNNATAVKASLNRP